MIRFSQRELGLMALFENLTKVTVKDLLELPDAVVVVVKEGSVGRAVGKNGSNVKKASEKFGKPIVVVEHSEEPKQFVANMLHPARTQNIVFSEKHGEKTALVSVKNNDKKILFANKKQKYEIAKKLLERHLGAQLVVR